MTFEFSAGGIVYKKGSDNHLYILVARHSQHHGWVFPKGLIGDHIKNESKETTAVREVEEETGVVGKIVAELSPTTYWYQWQGEKRKKTVYYFLMEFVSEDPTKRDNEMDAVEWLPADEVAAKLTYPSDKKVWDEANTVLFAR